MPRMKITAGLGKPEDYIRLASAGTDELFAGFVPLEWLEKIFERHTPEPPRSASARYSGGERR